jgi:Zinc carboxypeptidase
MIAMSDKMDAFRRVVSYGLLWFAAFLVLTGTASSQVPSPESVLGFQVGADRKLADWGQVVDYFNKVALASPDRVLMNEIGKSTLGKPFVALTISSADNLHHLDRYLEIQRRLADPRLTTEQQAEQFMHEGKAVVLITCTVHSSEVASTQTAMQFVFKLLAEDTPEHREILNNVIFLLIPSLNPDGQDMVVKWYRKYVGTPFEGAEPVELYHPYVGHDDNRDWYMFTQVESQLTVNKVQNVWHPQVVYDVHQMGPGEARLFVPPFLDPVDPNIDPLITSETNWLGTSMAQALATEGKKGVAINAVYDEWTPARHYQAYHAGLRILTESASAQLASPITVPLSQLDSHALGYNPRQRSWNFPDPWPGGEWRLGDIVSYQLIAYESCLLTVARNREVFLRNFYRVSADALDPPKGYPFAYIFPAQQKDPAAAAKLLNTLRIGLVEVYRAQAPFSVDGVEYSAGAYVVPIAQPYGRYAKTLLERQRYPDDRQYPGGPPKHPYDVTAQTLPLLMGVQVSEVHNRFQTQLEKIDSIPLPPGKIDSPAKQYLLRPDSNNAYLAVNRLLKQGAAVFRLQSALTDGDREYPAGTFVIRSKQLRNLASLGVDFSATSLPLADAKALRSPRVGIYKSYVPSIDEGWTRWLMEQYEFPYTSIFDHDIRHGNLNSRFDVIVIPDEMESAIVRGNPKRSSDGEDEEHPLSRTDLTARSLVPEPYEPDEYTGGIGEAGVESLRQFVSAGGTLITLNRASEFAIDRLNLGARNILQGVSPQNFYGPGSILNITVNINHPLGYGMDKQGIAWFEQSPAFAPAFTQSSAAGATAVATYPNGNPLMSGWLLGDALIQNQAALMDAPLGKGHAVLFGFRPQYRGQSYATYKLFFNALFYFGL